MHLRPRPKEKREERRQAEQALIYQWKHTIMKLQRCDHIVVRSNWHKFRDVGRLSFVRATIIDIAYAV